MEAVVEIWPLCCLRKCTIRRSGRLRGSRRKKVFCISLNPGQLRHRANVFKARLLEILKAFPPEEPTRKKFIGEMIGWSARFGELDRGDPDMHHAAGCLYADGK